MVPLWLVHAGARRQWWSQGQVFRLRRVCREWDRDATEVAARLAQFWPADIERLAMLGRREALDWVVATFASPPRARTSTRHQWSRALLAVQETCHVGLVRWLLPAITERQANARGSMALRANTTGEIARIVAGAVRPSCSGRAADEWGRRARRLLLERYGRDSPRSTEPTASAPILLHLVSTKIFRGKCLESRHFSSPRRGKGTE